MIRAFHLGCPVWSHKPWTGTLFTARAQPDEYLRQYASVFNAVEGNATFYGLPRASSVERWGQETPEDFRFCFKFPQSITHAGRLRAPQTEVRAFLDLMAPLGTRLGPFMVQLPPAFGPKDLDLLADFLIDLPPQLPYAVEVRHPGFFSQGKGEVELDALLRARDIDRIIFDARGLWDSDPLDPGVSAAQSRKPRLPVSLTVTGRRPVVRFVAHARPEANRWLLKAWADQLAQWIGLGLSPHVFIHAPDEIHAPQLARTLHELLARRLDVGTLPTWPGEVEPPARQLGLF